MKLYVTDPYDEKLSIRGFCAQLIFMQADIYDYIFNFTFRRSLKDYVDDFCEQYNSLASDAEFFLRTKDRYVVHAVNTRRLFINCAEELLFRYGIDVDELMKEGDCEPESLRFKPYAELYKYCKSYPKLRLLYEKTLTGQINYLYKMACVFMIGRYRLPNKLSRALLINKSVNLDLLDDDNNLVATIKNLIIDLLDLLDELREMNVRPAQTKFD